MQIVGCHGYDIVIVGQFARLGAEAQVEGLGELDGLSLEAFFPIVYGPVLEIDPERGFFVVNESDFGGDGICPDATSLWVMYQPSRSLFSADFVRYRATS